MWPLIVLTDKDLYTLAGRAGEPFARARAGQRADDGRLGAHNAAGASDVSRLAALLHAGVAGGKRQRMRPRAANDRRRPGHAALHWMIAVALVAAIAGRAAPLAAQALEPPRLLDDFAELSAWHAGASDGVRASIHAADGIAGRALQLDFDLAGTAGYALARPRAAARPAGQLRDFTFCLRGDAPVNDLQVKLTDAAATTCGGSHRPNFTSSAPVARDPDPEASDRIRLGADDRSRARRMRHGWSSSSPRARGGGAGSIRISRPALRELPPLPAIWPAPVASASSHRPGAEAARRGRWPIGDRLAQRSGRGSGTIP